MSYYLSYFGSQNQPVSVGDHVLIEVNLNTPFMGMTTERLWALVNYINKDGTLTVTIKTDPVVLSAHLSKGKRIDIGLENIATLSEWQKNNL